MIYFQFKNQLLIYINFNVFYIHNVIHSILHYIISSSLKFVEGIKIEKK
jgi:hypothetical protein